MNVRFEGNNGHDADVTRCLLLTQSGHNACYVPFRRALPSFELCRQTSVYPRQDLLQGRKEPLPPALGALVPAIWLVQSISGAEAAGPRAVVRLATFVAVAHQARPASGPRDALRRPVARPRPEPSGPRPSALLRGTAVRSAATATNIRHITFTSIVDTDVRSADAYAMQLCKQGLAFSVLGFAEKV